MNKLIKLILAGYAVNLLALSAQADCSFPYDDQLVVKAWEFDRNGAVAEAFLADSADLAQLVPVTSKEEMALAWYKYAHLNAAKPELMGRLFTRTARQNIIQGKFAPLERKDFFGEYFEFYNEFCKRKSMADSMGGIDVMLRKQFNFLIKELDHQTRRLGPDQGAHGLVITWKVEGNSWRVDSIVS